MFKESIRLTSCLSDIETDKMILKNIFGDIISPTRKSNKSQKILSKNKV